MKAFSNEHPPGAAPQVRHEIVAAAEAGRRLDHFLATRLRGLPRARLHRSLRKGEVRVNGGRVRSGYRLCDGDRVRIPPLHLEAPPNRGSLSTAPIPRLEILYKDASLLVLNKPGGWAVHGGSGLRFGLIEALKARLPENAFLELVHRLDRETSGCLLLARDVHTLRGLHELLQTGRIQKHYWALLLGERLRPRRLRVELPLERCHDGPGRRRVRVSPEGRSARSEFRFLESLAPDLQWVEVRTGTGRTHQVRAHAAAIGRPVAGDALYGNRERNRVLRGAGLRRLFLHAHRIAFRLPETEREYRFDAPLSEDLAAVLRRLGPVHGAPGVAAGQLTEPC